MMKDHQKRMTKRVLRKMMKLMVLDILKCRYSRVPRSANEKNQQHCLPLTTLVMLKIAFLASVGSQRCTIGLP
jgi:hypothetical protein